MPYNNPYNREIAAKVRQLQVNKVNHDNAMNDNTRDNDVMGPLEGMALRETNVMGGSGTAAATLQDLGFEQMNGTHGVPEVRPLRKKRATTGGGVSAAPFDSMNLGIASAPGEPDTEANVDANAARLMQAIGAGDARMVRVRQVHGRAVHACAPGAGPGAAAEADAVVSGCARQAACVRTADCVPVLVACPDTGAVAAIHAGWRGIVAGVVAEAIGEMERSHGCRASALVAAIGPCIGRDAYEVGPEVAGEFAAAVGARFVLPAGEGRAREHVDCFGAVRSQLVACGLPGQSIDGTELCTVRTPDFFSHRRDGARSGRMGAVILPRAGAAAPAQ